MRLVDDAEKIVVGQKIATQPIGHIHRYNSGELRLVNFTTRGIQRACVCK